MYELNFRGEGVDFVNWVGWLNIDEMIVVGYSYGVIGVM